jgi:hypothetical protein
MSPFFFLPLESMRRAWEGSLWTLLLACTLEGGLGYIVLTKEGYSVEHKVFAQAGVNVAQNLTVHGLLISLPSAMMRCNPSRKGALRWTDNSTYGFPADGPRAGSFEACDGEPMIETVEYIAAFMFFGSFLAATQTWCGPNYYFLTVEESQVKITGAPSHTVI